MQQNHIFIAVQKDLDIETDHDFLQSCRASSVDRFCGKKIEIMLLGSQRIDQSFMSTRYFIITLEYSTNIY